MSERPPAAATWKALCALLERERQCLRTVDAAAVGELAEEKRALAAALAAPANADERRHAVEARRMAGGNALLLHELVRMLQRRVGIVDAGTYDARARKRPALRPQGTRAL